MKEMLTKEILVEAKELENIEDCWYFVKSASGAWIAGSGN